MTDLHHLVSTRLSVYHHQHHQKNNDGTTAPCCFLIDALKRCDNNEIIHIANGCCFLIASGSCVTLKSRACVSFPDDVVYLPDQSLLQEYVMNEDGVIYMGSWDSIRSISWSFGQVAFSLSPSHTHTHTHTHTLHEGLCVCVCQASSWPVWIVTAVWQLRLCGFSSLRKAVCWTEEASGREVRECNQTTQTRACPFTERWKDGHGGGVRRRLTNGIHIENRLRSLFCSTTNLFFSSLVFSLRHTVTLSLSLRTMWWTSVLKSWTTPRTPWKTLRWTSSSDRTPSMSAGWSPRWWRSLLLSAGQ